MAKLVRDRIPEIVVESGLTVQFRKAKDDNEYLQFLVAKMDEEVQELKDALYAYREVDTDDILEELGDIRTVTSAIAYAIGRTHSEMVDAQISKCDDKGEFKKRYIMEDLNETNNLDDRDETRI